MPDHRHPSGRRQSARCRSGPRWARGCEMIWRCGWCHGVSTRTCTGEYGAACFRARAGSLPDVSGWPLFGEGIRAFDGVATAHYLQEQAAFLSEALRE
jgi:hypothetical protein